MREARAKGNKLEAREVSRLDLSFCVASGQVFPEPGYASGMAWGRELGERRKE